MYEQMNGSIYRTCVYTVFSLVGNSSAAPNVYYVLGIKIHFSDLKVLGSK